MTAIHQFLPTLRRADAIGRHTLELRELLRRLGVESEIYAAEVQRGLSNEARPLAKFTVEDARTWLLYQASTASPVAEFVSSRPEPKIVDYHNFTPARFFTGWDPAQALRMRTAADEIKPIVAGAELVFAHSRFSARDIEEWGGSPVIAPVLGSRLLRGDQIADSPLGSYSGAGGGAEWLFVGRLAPNKAQHQLIKSLVLSRRVYDADAVLHLVGEPSSRAYADALLHLARSAGVADAIRLHGSISDSELAARYRSADVFVCASEHEGFCLPVLEAMQFGVPVVARAAGAIPETAAGSALLVPGGSPAAIAAGVHRVLSDTKLRERMRAAGYANAAAESTTASDPYVASVRALLEDQL